MVAQHEVAEPTQELSSFSRAGGGRQNTASQAFEIGRRAQPMLATSLRFKGTSGRRVLMRHRRNTDAASATHAVAPSARVLSWRLVYGKRKPEILIGRTRPSTTL